MAYVPPLWSGPFTDAGRYAVGSRAKESAGVLSRVIIGFSFAGACLLPLLFLAPLLLKRRWIALAAVLAAIPLATATLRGHIGSFPLQDAGGLRWGTLAQV